MNHADQTQPSELAPFPPRISVVARLGWVSFFNDASSEALARVLPLLLTTGLGVSPIFVGVIEGTAEAVGVFLRGASGWLSDRIPSRKPRSSRVEFGRRAQR